MLSNRADLHCHTNLSDSSLDVENTVLLAAKRGLRSLAITDHDTMGATEEAVKYGEKYGIEIIEGVEFSTYDYERKRRVHILAYGVKGNERLKSIYEKTTLERTNAGLIMLEKLLKLYPNVSKEMLTKYTKGCASIYKQHFTHALCDAGYAKSIFGEDHKRLFNSKNGLANEPIKYPDVYDVVKACKEEGAVISLAHPFNYDSKELFEELSKKELINCVEVWHETANEEETAYLYKKAQEYNLIMTGGTDFHGMYHSVPVPIGSYTTDYSELEKIKKLINK